MYDMTSRLKIFFWLSDKGSVGRDHAQSWGGEYAERLGHKRYVRDRVRIEWFNAISTTGWRRVSFMICLPSLSRATCRKQAMTGGE